MAFPSFHNPVMRKAAGALLAVAIIVAAAIFARGSGKELDARHQSLAFSENFDFETGSFVDYIAYAERRIRSARSSASDEFIANLLPFRLEPAADCPASESFSFRNGIVLTHDMLETPYSMRFLAEYFQLRCFVVYGLLLPGHATQPGDLLQASREEWVAAERFAARELAREAENLYLGGHGIGGTLAILEASRNADVDGLVLFAPALAKKPLAWQEPFASLLGWLLPGARWADVTPPWSDFIYDSSPWRLRGEVDALVEATLDALPNRPFEVPVFGIITTEDASVSAPAALAYMAERTHPLTQTHVFSRNPAPAQPGQRIHSSQFRTRVLSLSHPALVKHYNDPELGYDGKARDCGHYYRSDRPSYDRCMAGSANFRGEVIPELLAEGVLERVGSNIHIDTITFALDAFVAPVGRVPVYIER
jgi:hypothetical protein